VETARYLLLLSRIAHQQERYEEKVQYLMKAKETQDRFDKGVSSFDFRRLLQAAESTL